MNGVFSGLAQDEQYELRVDEDPEYADVPSKAYIASTTKYPHQGWEERVLAWERMPRPVPVSSGTHVPQRTVARTGTTALTWQRRTDGKASDARSRLLGGRTEQGHAGSVKKKVSRVGGSLVENREKDPW